MTLVSTGTSSIFLSPVDALHGDIGMLGKHDLLVLLCKNGGADELISLIPIAKAKGVEVIGITSDEGSRVAELCGNHILIPCRDELCPMNVTPVTSPALELLFGDICAVAVMQKKSFSVQEYATNHPAGRIGKRLVLCVEDVMKPWDTLPLIKPCDHGMQALVCFASESKGCGCLVVVDDERKLLGTLADADLRRALAKRGEEALSLSVQELMNFNKSYPRTALPKDKAYEAQQKMAKDKPVDYLPVISDPSTKRLVGLVTSRTLLDAGL